MHTTVDMPTVLFVKKLLAGGEPCAKCRDIENRLRRDGLMSHVTGVVLAKEGDPSSPGARIAERHGVTRAPFFVLRDAGGYEEVIESYLAFKQWFSGKGARTDEPASQELAGDLTRDLADAVDRHPDLALI
ncbi:MAG: hypothetical protein WB783_12910 [Arenicellales bacterium]|jgi:hypothetical protein